MKKIITASILALTMATSAQALPSTAGFVVNPRYMHYQRGYQIGYHTGKQHAYDNVARTVAVVGATVVVGLIIYELGKESRWTANEKGVVYKF